MSQTMNEDLNVIANSDLEITYLDGDLAIIQQLDDEPNDVGGLTSAQLKAKFDQAGLAIQSYLNNTLIPELLAADATEAAREAAEAGRQAAEQARVTAEAARAAAEQERVNTTSGIVAQATQKANEAAASAVRAEQVALGNIPDGSLAKAKLVPEVQNAVNRALPGGEIDGLLEGKVSGPITALQTHNAVDNAKSIGFYTFYGYEDGAFWDILGHISGTLFAMPIRTEYEQFFFPEGNDFVARRLWKEGGTDWEQWEVFNPPMLLGVEYRTTERYLGKPVYAKVVDFGFLPNNTEKQVALSIDGIQHIVECSARYNGGDRIPLYNTATSPAQEVKLNYVSNYNGGFVRIASNYDASGSTAHLIIKYTKTTD